MIVPAAHDETRPNESPRQRVHGPRCHPAHEFSELEGKTMAKTSGTLDDAVPTGGGGRGA